MVTQIVVAVIRRGGGIVLVRQQGPDEDDPVWALPGGVVEEGELLTEALAREVREETGLDIRHIGHLAYVAQLHNPTPQLRAAGELPEPGGLATVFAFELDDPGGAVLANDPDTFVSEAQWCSLPEAIERLKRLPWRFMREPVVAYLTGPAPPGATWLYRRTASGEDELYGRLPSPIGGQEEALGEPPPEASSQRSIVVLGCLVLTLVLAVLVVIGIVTLLQAGH